MKIISWNVNGIRAVHNKGLFVPFVKKYKPDILCLQETKANATSMAELYPKTCRICQSSPSFPKNVLNVAKATSRKFSAPRQEILPNLQRLKSSSAILVACDHQSEVDLPDYEEYWNSAERPGYSGTAIFTKEKPLSVINGLPEKIVPMLSHRGSSYKFADSKFIGTKKYGSLSDKYGDPNTEGRVITAEFKKFYMVSVYTPNSKDDLSRIPLRHKQWDPAFLEYMRTLEKSKPVIFCGDLNVAHTPDDLANPKPNMGSAFAKAPAKQGKKGFTDEEREGIQKIIDAGFVDTFRLFTKGNGHYTWWSRRFPNLRARNVGWRIDYIFASKSLKSKIKKSLIHPDVFGSDHCPIELEIAI